MMQAGKRFLQVLRAVDVDKNAQISLEEFKMAFQKVSLQYCVVENGWANS